MNTYTVTIQLADREQFTHFIDNVGPLVDRVVISVTQDTSASQADLASGQPEYVRKPVRKGIVPKARKLRGSKVNSTILEAMEGGPKTVKELKDALEAADLAAGSLSTGLATLQRSGEVERVGEGLYGLKGQRAEAAE